MKKDQKVKAYTVVALLFFGLFVFIASCSKDDDSNNNSSPAYTCKTCTDTPDALPANDASGKGVYKGVIVGSSGILSVNIQNGSNTITATMVLDGVSVLLTSSVNYVDGEPYIAPFTGTYNGSPVTINFSVGLDGSAPTVTSADIPGHPNAVFVLAKEKSTSLIEAFEGKYKINGVDMGTFNIILSSALGKFGGIAKETATGEIDEIDGNYSSTGQLTDPDGRVLGTIVGDELKGVFTDNNKQVITISGKRTL
ncbi:MAG: hypothetical protein ACI7YS_00455 [Flavobacterium sp.]